MSPGIVPLISSIVSFIFAVTVLDQYFARRKAFQLVWAAGLFMYCVATFTEFYTETFGLQETVYRLWYLFGAIFVAAWLGQGTVYLLARRSRAHFTMALLAAASLAATIVVFIAPVDLTAISELSGKAFPGYVRAITPVLNTYGTVALVGGAVWSAWVFARKRILPHRVTSNILIAVGAFLPAFGGTALRFGAPRMFLYVPEMVGIIIIFIGFLRTKEVFGFFRFPLVHGFGRLETKVEAKPQPKLK